jgi:hypothetical protein
MADVTSASTWSGITATVASTQSVINLGGFDSSYLSTAATITITPSTQNTNSFTLTSFGFGKTFANSTASYQTLLNSNLENFGLNTNVSNLAMNFRGLGLPTNQFK